MSKPFVWRAEFTLTVAPVWVADGFDLTEERLNRILEEAFSNELGFATEDEVLVAGKVTKAPAPSAIRKEQGGE